MSKSVYDPMKDDFLVENSRELYVNIDLLYRNSSPQEFENLFREGGALYNIISSYKDSLKNNLKDVDIDEITQDYIPGENLKINLRGTDLNDLARNLVDLSDNILNKQNPFQSIEKFRTLTGAGDPIQPSFFARIQTFFVNLFTDNKTKQKANALENFEITINKVLDQSKEFALENNRAREDLQKSVQQGISLSSDLPPPPSYNLDAPSRDVPPIPEQFSGQTADLPPPPQVNASQEISSPAVEQPLPPPPQANNLSPLPPEFGGPPTDLPPPLPQALNTSAADIPPPTDLPPPLPPEFGGQLMDLPPSLPPEDLQISNEIGTKGKDTGQALNDVLVKQGEDNISPEDDRDLGDNQDREGSDITAAKIIKQDEVKFIEPITITKGVIPPPPSGKGPPPPPGPMIVKSPIKDSQIKTPFKPTLEKGDFLKEELGIKKIFN